MYIDPPFCLSRRASYLITMCAFFSRSLFHPACLCICPYPLRLSSTSLPWNCCPRHSHCRLVPQSTLFTLSRSVPPRVFPLDDNTILPASSLATPSASSFSHRCGNLGPGKGRRRTACEFCSTSQSAPHPACLVSYLILFSGILAAGLWWVLAAPDSFGRHFIDVAFHGGPSP